MSAAIFLSLTYNPPWTLPKGCSNAGRLLQDAASYKDGLMQPTTLHTSRCLSLNTFKQHEEQRGSFCRSGNVHWFLRTVEADRQRLVASGLLTGWVPPLLAEVQTVFMLQETELLLLHSLGHHGQMLH